MQLYKDPIFIWKARLLKRIYDFGFYAGFLTLLFATYFHFIYAHYWVAAIFVAVYAVFCYSYFKSGLSFTFKANIVAVDTLIIGVTLFTILDNPTSGFLWVAATVFFASIFLNKKTIYTYLVIIFSVVLLYIFDFYYGIIPFKYSNLPAGIEKIKDIISFIFIVAAMVYSNDIIIVGLSKAFKNVRDSKKELETERTNLEKLNKEIVKEVEQKEMYRKDLEHLNKNLNDEVLKKTDSLQQEIRQHEKTEKELVKTKEDLLNVLKQEKVLNELKSKFISMISHEYRTPLTVIMNSTYLLEKYFEKGDKEGFDKSINGINKSIENMTELLEEVIKFGGSQGSLADKVVEKFDLSDTIKRSIEKIQSDFRNSHKVIFDNDKKMIVSNDEKFLSYIITNVLKNAVKYSPDGSDVIIKVKENSDNYILSIQDFGIGIKEENKKKIFEPFYRGDNIITESGTGLGLAVSKRYADALNVDIDFESEEDKGTTFYLKIPRII